MKPSRNLWPYGVLAAFVLFATGIATAVTIALKHPESLVSDNYYEQELKYQSQINDAARARNVGAEIRFDAAEKQAVIALPNGPAGQPITGTVQLYRADAPALDHTVDLKLSAGGVQTLDCSKLASGPWLLKVAWQSGGQGYYLEQKVIVPAS